MAEIEKTYDVDIDKNNKCFILYILKEEVNKDDINILINAATLSIVNDEALTSCTRYDSIVVTLIDTTNKIQYFVPNKGFGISIYKFGIKKIKKLNQ